MVESDEASGETLEPLRDARPAGDPLRKAEVRAAAEQALFRKHVETRIGRFVVIDTLGAGGMGMVHRARDPELEREVALKVIHPRFGDSDAARERLIAEARALAKLKHPNVVPVHDVLVVDDQVVVVMELIEGETLATWERETVRPWRDVLTRYVAAGRGLEAAHALGIVHRDFKPANVIVGADGRVRVLDFGLARVGSTPPDAAGAAAAATDGLTATGDVVGTPAYMSPEQLAGEGASAASDQFSFCVSLHHALFGVRPFAGESPEKLLAAIRAGRIEGGSQRTSVPRQLRAIVARGLAASPGDRHPSMRALLGQLDREHGWRRWRMPALVGGMALVATAGVAAAMLREPSLSVEAACEASPAELDAAWSPAQREQVRAALIATGTPYARAAVDRVVGGLDAYRAAWGRAHRDACVASRRGAQSSTLSDRRAICLERRKDDLAAAAAVLTQIEHDSAAHAMDVVGGLPPLAWCGDLEALSAEGDPPATEALRRQVADVRQRLSRVAALERAGRITAASELVETLSLETSALAYAPVTIEVGLVKARILLARGDFAAAVPVLASIEALALEHRQYAAATTAAARRVYAEGLIGNDLPGLRRQIAVIEPLGRGLVGDSFAQPLLLNNIGSVYLASGDRVNARRYFEAARDALHGVAEPDLELAFVDVNLALLTPEPTKRVALVRGAWERLRDRLGAEHPLTVRALYAYARYTPDHAEARRLIDEACTLYESVHPDMRIPHIECAQYRAQLTEELGDPAAAAARHDEVVSLTAGETDREMVSWRDLSAGYASLARGDAEGALTHFVAVIEEWSKQDTFWDQVRVAHGQLGAGLAEHALHRETAAVAHLERAAATFTEAAAMNEDSENRILLARARAALAAASRATKEPSR